MWGDAVNRVRLLRQRHRVWPTDMRGPGVVCHHDGVRIHPHGRGWRHDTPEIVRLNEQAAALAKPGQL